MLRILIVVAAAVALANAGCESAENKGLPVTSLAHRCVLVGVLRRADEELIHCGFALQVP